MNQQFLSHPHFQQSIDNVSSRPSFYNGSIDNVVSRPSFFNRSFKNLQPFFFTDHSTMLTSASHFLDDHSSKSIPALISKLAFQQCNWSGRGRVEWTRKFINRQILYLCKNQHWASERARIWWVLNYYFSGFVLAILHAVLSWLSYLGCPAEAFLAKLSFPCNFVLAVLSWMSCSGCLVLAVQFLKSYYACPSSDVFSWLFYPGRPGCPIQAVLSWLFFLAVLSCMSCSGIPVLAVLSF